MKTPLCLLAVLLAVLRTHAATYTVTNSADGGPGSLRQAIADANATVDADTITFAPALNGQIILLTSGQLSVSNNLSILGPGPNQPTIDGGGSNRVFYLAPGLTNFIAGITITGGLLPEGSPNTLGSGIYNHHSTLTLSNVTLNGNLAFHAGGGIYNDGKNGGSATLTLKHCTLRDNKAFYGAGIANDGSAGRAETTLVDCTVSGNSAYTRGGTSSGGAIYCTISSNYAFIGGGIDNEGNFANATLTLQNCTLSGNLAVWGGGIFNAAYQSSASLVLRHCTLSGNSAHSGGPGGIFSGASSGNATLTIAHTLLAKGTNGLNFSGSGTITNLGYNLSDDASAVAFATTVSNLFLGPLADNGGPTFTHALLPGTPAINAGDPNFTGPPDFDQRGPDFPRVSSGIIDVGAFETQPMVPPGPMLVNLTWDATGGSFSFAFENDSGARFRVLAATNPALPLSNWTVLGDALEFTPGQYRFVDTQASNAPQRFYRVRSP